MTAKKNTAVNTSTRSKTTKSSLPAFYPHMKVMLEFRTKLDKLLEKHHPYAQLHASHSLYEYWIRTNKPWSCVLHYSPTLGIWQGYHFGLGLSVVPVEERAFSVEPRKLASLLDELLAASHPDFVPPDDVPPYPAPKAKPATKKQSKSKARR